MFKHIKYKDYPLDIKVMILDKNIATKESNEDDNFTKALNKLQEEFEELKEAILSGNRLNIAEEAFDLEQVLQRVFLLLNKEEYDLEQLNIRHNKKLLDRGWVDKGIIKYKILKRK